RYRWIKRELVEVCEARMAAVPRFSTFIPESLKPIKNSRRICCH
ncbi:uncharacterized, partial [Tachysurus ichikawai]